MYISGAVAAKERGPRYTAQRGTSLRPSSSVALPPTGMQATASNGSPSGLPMLKLCRSFAGMDDQAVAGTELVAALAHLAPRAAPEGVLRSRT
jgi:hypothetical protein